MPSVTAETVARLRSLVAEMDKYVITQQLQKYIGASGRLVALLKQELLTDEEPKATKEKDKMQKELFQVLQDENVRVANDCKLETLVSEEDKAWMRLEVKKADWNEFKRCITPVLQHDDRHRSSDIWYRFKLGGFLYHAQRVYSGVSRKVSYADWCDLTRNLKERNARNHIAFYRLVAEFPRLMLVTKQITFSKLHKNADAIRQYLYDHNELKEVYKKPVQLDDDPETGAEHEKWPELVWPKGPKVKKEKKKVNTPVSVGRRQSDVFFSSPVSVGRRQSDVFFSPISFRGV